ncbi:glycine/betaine ABC transporter ATP-binding protein [Desulfoluna limicola]|uniref:Glycine/betaine ABC transporter ATP-binding protein n=1 Tax=Desulfoluna limicola TaxID=2810562 RepID=A0ABM7PE72_9BACT|nr:glycine betaine/L-proline ABC transporter ATP-binding protein [Desulfoluna limicola]BCS95475.1 glycine/betaine ABC transporter ATP-binding protein [Desulfoluna limicola]
MNKIEVKDLVKIFGPTPKRALAMLRDGAAKEQILEKTGHGVGVGGVTFDVKAGEIIVIMGLSGSGKSTLVRCLNRLIDPTAGSIIVDGIDIAKVSNEELLKIRQQKFGMVFQNFALFPHRTVAENAAYGLEIQGMDKEPRLKRAYEVLGQVGLSGWEESYPSQLSGGMQQRVGLARALAVDPDILLMDEAFSALDPLIRRDMQDELLDLQDRLQKTIVFISHDLDEALKIGDRIVLMKDGRVVQVGTPDEILMEPATRYVEKFVEDVDITKVLTAEAVMKKPFAVGHVRNDGPRAALRKMKNEGISSLFVTKRDHSLLGIITASDAKEAAERGDQNLEAILQRDLTTVPPDAPASELFEILKDLPYPLAVVTETEKLAGVIVRGTLLAALAEGGRSA